jgi:DNA-binding response OmpR family regulator
VPSKTILCIDDNQDLVRALEVRLRNAGFAVLHAHTACRGIELAGQCRPDLILLDLHLPDQDGYHVLKWLRSTEPTRETPIIIFTSHGVLGELPARQLGATDYLTKPCESQDLIAAIHDALNRTDSTRDSSDPLA